MVGRLGSEACKAALSELPSQHAQTLIQTRLDGAERTPDEVGDLPKGQTVVFLEHDHGALFVRQGGHQL